MNLFNLLDANPIFELIGTNGEVPLNFLGVFIGFLIGLVGVTGVGIILYCLILKVVILPLDVWQRASQRKQNLKMEQMRGQLEKLQKQYENNQQLYQKKVQDIYKENNFNMFSTCIPMIATLAILLVAFNSLTAYSQYENLKIYTDMGAAYNAAILEYADPSITKDTAQKDGDYLIYKGDNPAYFVYYKEVVSTGEREYYVDMEKITALSPETDTADEAIDYIENIGSKAAAESYNNSKKSFLWIKNIFYPDVAWAHPLQSYEEFCKSISNKIVILDENGNKTDEKITIREFISEATYNSITADLEAEKSKPNGFFILVALTILSNLASQFIIMRSQKAQRELQTADKSTQSMQKWMMLLMPIMFCVFAFIYSAAFSLYLITSSLFSLASTLVVNKVIDSHYKKQKAAQEATRANGRVALSRDWNKNEELKKNNNKKNK